MVFNPAIIYCVNVDVAEVVDCMPVEYTDAGMMLISVRLRLNWALAVIHAVLSASEWLLVLVCKKFYWISSTYLLILYSMFTSLVMSWLGLSHWDPYAMHRGGCLELFYCNMVEWSWWDSSLICKTNYFPSVLWHCWFDHMTCKIVHDMTYNVFGGMLNLALSIYLVMACQSN